MNVPINASVSTTPRTTSSANRRSSASPNGRSNNSPQATGSSTSVRSSVRDGNGSVSDGKTRCATRPVIP